MLATIFNELVKEGWFPLTWAKAIAVPLYKVGKMSLPGNYQYIMLNAVFYKVYGLQLFTPTIAQCCGTGMASWLQEGTLLPPPYFNLKVYW